MRAGSAYQDGDLVFATKCGTPINPSNLRNRSFAPLLKKASLPKISFHDLRHTTTSLLFSKNVHPKFAQELLGHACVAFTLATYSHMLPGMGGEAADAMGCPRVALGGVKVVSKRAGVSSGPFSNTAFYCKNTTC